MSRATWKTGVSTRDSLTSPVSASNRAFACAAHLFYSASANANANAALGSRESPRRSSLERSSRKAAKRRERAGRPAPLS
eukprot:scaffold1130_cov195-Pinguiococcus_pyrenoidosus.AAC.2